MTRSWNNSPVGPSTLSIMLRKLRRVFYFRTVLFYACGSLCAILLLVNFNEDVKKLLQQSQYTSGGGGGGSPHNDHVNSINGMGLGIESALMSSRDVFPSGSGNGPPHNTGKSNSHFLEDNNRRDLNGNSINGNNFMPTHNVHVHSGDSSVKSLSGTGSVDRSYQVENKRPWFMSRGTQFPQSQAYYSSPKLWPEEDPTNDRIVEQLMYVLDDSSIVHGNNGAPLPSFSYSSSSSSTLHNATSNNNNNVYNTNLFDDRPQSSNINSNTNKGRWTSSSNNNNNKVKESELIPLNSQSYLSSSSGHSNNNNNFNKSVIVNNGNRIKTILFYYGLGMSWGSHVTNGRSVFLQEKCPINTCRLSGNRAQIGKADAVVFKDVFMNPKIRRPPNQLWIMYLLECPLNTQNFVDKNMFNMTATYRHDSDIVTPYEKWVYHDDLVRSLPQAINYAAGKTKKVAWFVSNCVAKNNRLEFARELGKHIEVDIYGACGSHSCSRANAKQCFDLLSKHYKFYLAFENSNCRDYISEKFFVNGLGNSVLPIVMGAHPHDYARVAPEKSYIHVDDFASPKELAQYLKKLDEDDDLYNEYFKWKGTGEFVNTHFFCRLCAMVHYAQNSKNRFYNDFNKWWRGTNVCTRRSWRNQPDIFAQDYYDKQTTNHDTV